MVVRYRVSLAISGRCGVISRTDPTRTVCIEDAADGIRRLALRSGRLALATPQHVSSPPPPIFSMRTLFIEENARVHRSFTSPHATVHRRLAGSERPRGAERQASKKWHYLETISKFTSASFLHANTQLKHVRPEPVEGQFSANAYNFEMIS